MENSKHLKNYTKNINLIQINTNIKTRNNKYQVSTKK